MKTAIVGSFSHSCFLRLRLLNAARGQPKQRLGSWSAA